MYSAQRLAMCHDPNVRSASAGDSKIMSGLKKSLATTMCIGGVTTIRGFPGFTTILALATKRPQSTTGCSFEILRSFSSVRYVIIPFVKWFSPKDISEPNLGPPAEREHGRAA